MSLHSQPNLALLTFQITIFLPQKEKERHRLKMIGRKRCADSNWQYNKQTLKHMAFQIISFSFKNVFLFIFSTASTTSESLHSTANSLWRGQTVYPLMQRDFSPMSFSANPHDLFSAWNHTKYCKTFVREELILVSFSCRTLSEIQESRQILQTLSINQNRR